MAAGDVVTQPTLYVQARLAWTDDWVTVNYLYPLQATDAVAPSIGQAAFEFDYGFIKKADQTTFSNYDPLDINGYYVRIMQIIFPSGPDVVWWVGRIDTEELQPGGVNGLVRQGKQIFTAWGIEFQLNRSPIDIAQATTGVGGTVEIDWVPEANYRSDSVQTSIRKKTRKRGNRSNSVNADGVYEFSDDGATWSNLDLVNMMLFNYLPVDAPPFILGGAYAALDGFHDTVKLKGKIVWQVLNELIDRRRGLGFFTYINGSNQAVIYVFTVLGTALTIGGVTVPANTNTLSLNFDTSIEILQARVIKCNSVKYDKVLIRGSRILSTFTVARADGNLVEDWASADQTAYQAAGSGVTGYVSLIRELQEELNDRIRSDEKFDAVFVRQRIPANWDGKAGDGVGGTKNFVIPVCAENGAVTLAGAPFSALDKHFEKALPFEMEKDYIGLISAKSPAAELPYVKRISTLACFVGFWTVRKLAVFLIVQNFKV